jgi:hypothetical protein
MKFYVIFFTSNLRGSRDIEEPDFDAAQRKAKELINQLYYLDVNDGSKDKIILRTSHIEGFLIRENDWDK